MDLLNNAIDERRELPGAGELRAKMEAARGEGIIGMTTADACYKRSASTELISYIRQEKERHIQKLSALHNLEAFLLRAECREAEAIQQYLELSALAE